MEDQNKIFEAAKKAAEQVQRFIKIMNEMLRGVKQPKYLSLKRYKQIKR